MIWLRRVYDEEMSNLLSAQNKSGNDSEIIAEIR